LRDFYDITISILSWEAISYFVKKLSHTLDIRNDR